tara:strand:+ start:1451 stop:1714 length:264 start_codon:yes stop_codon:yes gene_type:complete
MAESKKIWDALTKSQERVAELESKIAEKQKRIDKINSDEIISRIIDNPNLIPNLESQIDYLQDKLSLAKRSIYRRFKDYIKDRVARW